MKSTASLLVIAVTAVGLFACGDEPTPGQNSEQQQNDNSQKETLETYDPEAGDRETALEFVIENGATIPFYFKIQAGDEPPPAWLTLREMGDEDEEATALDLHPNCMPRICEADEKPSCRDYESEILEVEPGDVVTYEWDGRHYESDGDCTTPVDVDDIELEVEICWGLEVDDENQQIEDRDCAGDDGFNPAESTEVTATVQ